MKKGRSKLYWLIYYSLLLLVLVSWQNPDQAPSTINRFAFLAASIVPPMFFSRIKILPFVVILFYTINIYGTALSYFPTYYYNYVPIFILGLYFAYNKNNLKISSSKYLLYLLFLVFTVDIVSSSEICDISYCYLILILSIIYYSYNDNNYVILFQYLFVVSSLVLSVEFFTTGRQYTQVLLGGTEREAWTDPNYFGSIVGMGVVQAILLLIGKDKKNIFLNISLITTIIVSVITLVLNASRGALLATIIAFSYYLLTSKSKWYMKLVIIVIGIILAVYMFNNDYFYILEERLSGDTTGSGRIVIWQKKLTAFANDSNILHWLFGLGNTGGAMLAFGFKRGFHNDYIGFLVSYGIIGFVLFVSSLVKPILKSTIYRKEVIVGILYLAVCCMTLEPFISGYLPFFGFHFCCLFMSKIKVNSNV